MAKDKEKEKPKTELTEVKTQLPAELLGALEEDAGVGLSTKMEDNIVPLVYLLQANSKAALKGHDKYVPGAEGGSIWLRNAEQSESLIDGEEGMIFLPCFFSKCWIEWAPDRGGFVARHAERPANARLVDKEGDDGKMRKGWEMPSGNTVNESREFSGFVKKDGAMLPYTIPLSGSGHQVGKNWMTAMNNQKTPSGKTLPIYSYYWRLRSKLRTVGENSWYQFDVSREAPITTMAERDLAKALHDAFVAGTKTSDRLERDVDDSLGHDAAEVDAA